MPLDMNKGRIVRGIPDYILVVSVLVPILLFGSGQTILKGDSFSSEAGMNDYMLRDWRSWTDDEWERFMDMIVRLNENDSDGSLPPEFAYFSDTYLGNEMAWQNFLLEFNTRMNEKYGPY